MRKFTDRSVTELEVRCALRLIDLKPEMAQTCFFFVKDGPSVGRHGLLRREGDGADKLDALKQLLLERDLKVQHYRNVSDIEEALLPQLQEAIAEAFPPAPAPGNPSC